jgi:hypothetical protein
MNENLQLHQLEVEREARDRIEADLRGQISNYEALLRASEKKEECFKTQLDAAANRLTTSENQNLLLSEQNMKLNKEIENMKAQLNYQKGLLQADEESGERKTNASQQDDAGSGRRVSRGGGGGDLLREDPSRAQALSQALQTDVNICSSFFVLMVRT